ncbi:unnamed protein product [Strongylus vulgaris]|uniref:Uncharacterized protein n=1 Tax=Strongylus vulgaris TaxID=40348 RepID=A0A3P7JA03_STRVU|nr:unnamed protein product [Strongylus vulgaris]
MKMTNDEYVFLLLGMRSIGFGSSGVGKEVREYLLLTFASFKAITKFQLAVSNGLTPFWEDTVTNNADGMDNVARTAAKYMLVVRK